MPQVLVIGYGNRLRSDDGVGVAAAEVLAELYRDDAAVKVIAAHQLTPELTADIAEVEGVLFLDASAEGTPGTINNTEIIADGGREILAHHCTPAVLLAMAQRLYGRAPKATSLTMAAASFELGDRLTREIQAEMPALVNLAEQIVSAWLEARRGGSS